MKKIILILLLVCLPVMGEEWEYKFIQFVPIDSGVSITLPLDPECESCEKIRITVKDMWLNGPLTLDSFKEKGWAVNRLTKYIFELKRKKVEKKKIKPKPKIKKSYFTYRDIWGYCPSGCVKDAEAIMDAIKSGTSLPLVCRCEEK